MSDHQQHVQKQRPNTWVRSRDALRILSVSKKTLSDWARKGYIETIPLPGRGQRQHRLYNAVGVLSSEPRHPSSPTTTTGGCGTATSPEAVDVIYAAHAPMVDVVGVGVGA